MSAKPKPQSTEIDHIRDTLTGVVNVVGETRADVKALDRKAEILDHKVETLDHKVETLDHKVDANQQENRDRFDQQDKEIAEIKEMLKVLLSR